MRASSCAGPSPGITSDSRGRPVPALHAAQPSSTPTSPAVASRIDRTRDAIIGSSNFTHRNADACDGGEQPTPGPMVGPPGFEVLDEQRNVHGLQDAIERPQQILLPDGKPGDGDRHSRGAHLLREPCQRG